MRRFTQHLSVCVIAGLLTIPALADGPKRSLQPSRRATSPRPSSGSSQTHRNYGQSVNSHHHAHSHHGHNHNHNTSVFRGRRHQTNYFPFSGFLHLGNGYSSFNYYRGPITPYYPYSYGGGYAPQLSPYGAGGYYYSSGYPYNQSLPYFNNQPTLNRDPFNNDVLNQARREEELRWQQLRLNQQNQNQNWNEFQNGNDPEAAQIVPPAPSSEAAREKSLESLRQGDFWFKQQKYVTAYARYKSARTLTKDLAEPNFRLAYALTASGHYEQAVDYFKRGLALQPEWPSVGTTFEELDTDENPLVKGAIRERVMSWVKEDIRDPNRLFLMGVLLHFDYPDKARVVFDAAYRLEGQGEHLLAFLKPVQPQQLQPVPQISQPELPAIQPENPEPNQTTPLTPLPELPAAPPRPSGVKPNGPTPADQPASENGPELQGPQLIFPQQ